MLKKLLFTLLFLSALSCKKEGPEKEYYNNGNLKSVYVYKPGFKGAEKKFYNENGVLVGQKIWKDSLNVIQKEYYRNKKRKAEGALYNGHKTGWWSFYNGEGILTRKTEFVFIDGKEVANQTIIYKPNGAVNPQESTVFSVAIKDTLKVGRSVGTINYRPVLSAKSVFNVYVGQGIKPDFSNLRTVKLDTFSSDDKNNIWFGVEALQSGKKSVGGILEELFYEANKDKTDLVIKKQYTYFRKDIYVAE